MQFEYALEGNGGLGCGSSLTPRTRHVQDVFTEDKGAFTGGIAISQIKSVGAEYVVIGHSERRHGNIASETDATFNTKVALPLCVCGRM